MPCNKDVVTNLANQFITPTVVYALLNALELLSKGLFTFAHENEH